MKRAVAIGKSAFFAIALMALSAPHPGCAGPKAAPSKDKHMAQSIELKPFGLDKAGLEGAKVFLAVYTPKTGMGKEQIEIQGNGSIKLIRSDNYRAPDETLPGKVDPGSVAALLALFESEGFMDMEMAYTTKSTIKNTWKIRLTLPSGEKSVSGEYGAAPPAFGRLIGAIRLVAGIGAPSSLGKRYFFHL